MIDVRLAIRKLLLGAARYSGASTLAAPLMGGCGAILMLHRVNSGDCSPLGVTRHLTITPTFLDRLLHDLKRQGLRIVPLDEMLESMRGGRRERVVAITADDAYLDNLTEALPVLEAHGAPFTLYVAPALISGEVEPWWEVVEELVARRDTIYLPADSGLRALDCADPEQKRVAAYLLKDHLTRAVAEEDQQEVLRRMGAGGAPKGPRRFMNWDEVRRLARHPLATIGAHTVHHYNLKRLKREQVLREMSDSVTALEIETGIRPQHFAYPYGSEDAVGPREVELARQASFRSAVTTRHGVLRAGHEHHMHALPRISVNGNFQRLAYMRSLLSGLTTPFANGGRRLVTV